MARENSGLAREQLICGCHIHVSVPDPESAIRAMNLLRRFLPVLCALAANSPYWEGRDTGFDSYRTEVWARWPSAGPPGRSSRGTLRGTGRPSGRVRGHLGPGHGLLRRPPLGPLPTLEIRIADVMPTVDDVVAVAGLARALVAWCLRQEPPRRRCATSSCGSYVARRPLGARRHPRRPTRRHRSARGRCGRGLLERVGDDLERLGDHTVVAGGVRAIVEGGNGATASAAPTPTPRLGRRARGAHLGARRLAGGDEA